ncbi:MAG: hypothetical protein WD073_04855 [Xanthobacteraceae bacterium]
MKVYVFPLVALALVAGSYSDEPSEGQMKRAFEASLSQEVDNTLALMEEVGGAEAVQKVRQAGGDRFAVRTFRKLDCTRAGRDGSHVCHFAVDVELMNGNLERQLSGRFSPGSSGLVFIDDV